MEYRVYSKYFNDEYINSFFSFLNNTNRNSYKYMLGFIYAIRLFDLYQNIGEEILIKFNKTLRGKKSFEDLLKEYNISLENEETVNSFKNV